MIEEYELLTGRYHQRMDEILSSQDEWHKRRYNGIGGSEMAAVLGISKYQTAYDLWLVKTGRKNPFSGNKHTYWGTVLESVVADEYAIQTGEKVRVSNKHYQSKECPWLVGNVDRLIVKNDQHDTKILECKTCTDDSAVDEDGMKEWGVGNSYHPITKKLLKSDDTVPFNYLVQVQHYMCITGYSEVDLAVLFMRTREFRIYTIKRNDQIIDSIKSVSEGFWKCVLLDNYTFALNEAENLQKIGISEPTGDYIEPTDDILQAVEMLKQIKQREKDLEKAKEEIENEIKLFIGENKGLTYEGKKLITYTKPSQKVTFDSKRFKEEHPEMFEELSKYENVTPVARSLRFVKTK